MKNALSLCLAVVVAGCASTPTSSSRDLTHTDPGFSLAEHRFWSYEPAPPVPASLERSPAEAVEARATGAVRWVAETSAGSELELWQGGPSADQEERTRWELVSWIEGDATVRLGMFSQGLGLHFFPRAARESFDASVITHRTTLHNVRGEPFALLPRGYDVEEKSHPKSSDEYAFVCLPESECVVRGFVHRSNLGPFFVDGIDDDLDRDVPEPLEMLPVVDDRVITLLDRHGLPSMSAKFGVLDILGDSDGMTEVVAYRFGVAFHGFVAADVMEELRALPRGLGGRGGGGTGFGTIGMGLACEGTKKIVLPAGAWIFGEPREGAEFAMLAGPEEHTYIVRRDASPSGWLPVRAYSPWGVFDSFVREGDVLRETPCPP